MEFIFEIGFPFIIFLFVLIASVLKKIGSSANTDQDREDKTPKWKKMYDTWEDVVGRIEKELNTQGKTSEKSSNVTEYPQMNEQRFEQDVANTGFTTRRQVEDNQRQVSSPKNRTVSHDVKLGKQDIINGVIMSEVLGKPRAMKPYRYGKYSK